LDRRVREVVGAFVVATAIVAVLWQVAARVPAMREVLPVLVAAVFLYVPARIAWRQGQDLGAYGLTVRPVGKSLIIGVGGPVIVFPIFAVVFVWFYGEACERGLAVVGEAMCRRFVGWDVGGVKWPPDFVELAFAQLVVVALPEELFFRGYVLGRLEEVWPPKWRLWGGGVGKALVASAVIFALGHVLVDLDVRRLTVFFPALLFGWMRSATGSIAAGVIAHTAANLYIDVLHRTFFR
jgi:uncharacterized protein